MAYLLVKDGNRQVPLSPGLLIMREEMRYMLMYKTLDVGSVVKTSGRMLMVKENKKGQYRLENMDKKKDKEAGVSEKLTRRERQVVGLLSNDKGTEQIAEVLGITERTVQAHIQNAKRNLSVCTRHGLVGAAIRKGIIR